MVYTVAEIARHLDGEVIGDGEIKLTGFAPANAAKEGDLTFAENETYFQGAEASAASAILIDGRYTSNHKTLIRVANARIAFAKVLPFFFPEPDHPPGIHPTAVVAESARIDPSVHIGPFCVIEDGTQIGPRTVLQGNNHIGTQSQLGESVRLYPRVVVYPRSQIGDRVRIHSGSVIGSDGFGYVVDQGVHRKIPQVGTVQIHEDVEIGANVTIDRGALGATVIGKGTKIDNLVQIAHNVVIGEHCILVAQGGIAGSTKIGNYTTLAGQVGIAGHVKIGNHVTVAAQSGIMHDIPDGEKWFGSPAQPSRQMMRQIAHLQKLPDLVRRIEELEKQIAAMQNSGQSTSLDSH